MKERETDDGESRKGGRVRERLEVCLLCLLLFKANYF